MPDLATGVKLALAGAAKAQRLPGVYVGTDGVRATVDVGGGRIPADLCGYQPVVGESVWVLFVGATATVLGPSVLKPGRGKVKTTPTGNKVTLTTVAGDVTVPFAAGLSLSVGQVVKLGGWNDGGFAYAVMSTSPPPTPAPPAPGAGGTDRTVTFLATDSGSFQSSWWTGQVYASDSNVGAWFYGSQIHDTIPDTAAILSCELYISVAQLLYAPPNIGIHGYDVKPAGTVAVNQSAPVGVSAGWNLIPTALADWLKANPGGIGCAHGGYNIFNSVGQDAQSGALRIHWR